MITLHGEEVRVGDRVWHLFHGWGEVTDIEEDRSYPIRVQWEEEEEDYDWFSREGKAYIKEKTPTLFWQPVKFETPKKPKQMEKAWQWICKQVGSNHYYLTHDCFATREEAEASGADGHGYYGVVEPYLPSEIEREKEI